MPSNMITHHYRSSPPSGIGQSIIILITITTITTASSYDFNVVLVIMINMRMDDGGYEIYEIDDSCMIDG